MEEFAHTSSYWVNDVMRLPAHSWRKVHLDFHNSAHVASIGEDFDPQTFVRKLQESHIAEIVLFAKDMHGFCYFPTASGVQHPGLKFDLLGQQVQGCNAASIKTYAYICALWDEKIAADHPQWCQINRKRETYLPKPDETPYWTNLCPSSPEVVQGLTNLAREVLEKYAVEGIWFDMVIPREEECFCPNCLAAMSAQGLDPEDNAHQRQYQHELNKQFLKALYDACQAARPGCAVDFNNQPAFGLGERVQWQENIDIEALPTSVWGYDYFPTAVRYVRTQPVAAFGMTGRFHRGWGDFGGFKTPDQLQAEAFAILAHGAGVDIGDQMPPNGVLDDAAYESIGAAFAEVEKLEPYLRDAKPVAEAALLIKGNPLDTLVTPSYAGWTKLLTELNIQFDLVDVDGDWSRYPVVIVDSAIVDEDLQLKLWRCRATLFYGTNPEGFSYDVRAEKCEFEPAYFAPQYGTNKTPVAIYGPSVGFELYSDDTNFATQTLPLFQRLAKHFTSHAQSPAARTTSRSVAFTRYTQAAIGFDVGFAYFQTGYAAYRTLVSTVMHRIMRSRLVRESNESGIHVHLWHYPREGTWLVHVFDSAVGRPSPQHPPYYEGARTLSNTEIRLRVGGRHWSAKAIRSGQTLKTQVCDGALEITLPNLKRYELIELRPNDMVAIIPAAGKGTRMSEITGGNSKELLPLGNSTVLEMVMNEAEQTVGGNQTLILSSDKTDLDFMTEDLDVGCAYQNVQNGLAPAVALGFEPGQSALILLPDTVFYPETPTPLLKQAIDKGADIAIAVEPVPEERVSQYGIAEFGMHTCELYKLLEKPQPSETKSRWAVAARYAFSAKACLFLKDWIEANLPEQGELSITPAIQAALDTGLNAVVIPIEGDDMIRYDCGSPEGYAKALKEIL